MNLGDMMLCVTYPLIPGLLFWNGISHATTKSFVLMDLRQINVRDLNLLLRIMECGRWNPLLYLAKKYKANRCSLGVDQSI